MISGEQQPEGAFPMEDRLTLINAAGNHSAKLGLAAQMCMEPERLWTPPVMEEQINALQGHEPGWAISGRDLRSYAERSFVFNGIARAVPSAYKGRSATAYQIKEKWADKTLAFCGAFMDWTLSPDHNLSLTSLLGISRDAGGQPTSSTRYKIFDQLLATPGLSPKELQDTLEIGGTQLGEGSIHAHVKRLKGLGVLAVESRMIDYNPDVRIGPKISDTLSAIRERKSLSGIITSVLHEQFLAAEKGAAVIDLRRLISLCHERAPTIDQEKIRRAIFSTEWRDGESQGWEFVRGPNHDTQKTVSISVHPDHRLAIADLRWRVIGLGNPDAREYYSETAQAILADPDAFSELMAKARQSSSFVDRQHHEAGADLAFDIHDILHETGTSSLHEVIAGLRRRGLTIADTTVSDHLNQLVEKRLIHTERVAPGFGMKREVLHYRSLKKPNMPFPEAERFILLSYLVNHEAKLVLQAMMSAAPEERRSITKLTADFNRLQGRTPAWPLAAGGLKSYLRDSLIPANLAEIVQRVDGDKQKAVYGANTKLAGRVLAFCGSFLEWSLAHQDISVIPLLGRTGEAGSHQSPEARYKIFRHLLQHPGSTPKDVHAGLELHSYNLVSTQHQIRRLGELGILAVTSRLIEHNPDIRITHDIVAYGQNVRKPGGELDVLSRAFKQLYETAGTTTVTTLEHVLAACQEIAPDVDLRRIRFLFNNHAARVKAVGWEVLREPGYDKNKIVTASVHKDYKSAITDFCERFEKIDDQEIREHYKEVARTILADQDAVRHIMSKGLRFSPYTAETRGDPPIRKVIFDIVAGMGEATIRQVVASLGRNGLTTDKMTVNEHLNNLAASGLLQATMKTRSRGTKVEVLHFSLAEEPADE